jgi:hypothetical protein
MYSYIINIMIQRCTVINNFGMIFVVSKLTFILDIQLIHNEYHVFMAVTEFISRYKPL